jgi:hypothetical protein
LTDSPLARRVEFRNNLPAIRDHHDLSGSDVPDVFAQAFLQLSKTDDSHYDYRSSMNYIVNRARNGDRLFFSPFFSSNSRPFHDWEKRSQSLILEPVRAPQSGNSIDDFPDQAGQPPQTRGHVSKLRLI